MRVCTKKKKMNGMKCEYAQKVNENDVGQIMIEINEEYHSF